MTLKRTFEGSFGAVACLLLPLLGGDLFAQVGPPPILLSQPLDLTAPLGGSAQFGVTVQSSTPVTYRWYANGGLIPGAETSTLVLSNVHWSDQGRYAVAAQNASGLVMSTPAMLTITNVPLQLFIADPTVEGFSLNLSGPLSSRYLVEGASDCATWQPLATNAAMSGSMAFTDKEAQICPSRVYRGQVLDSLVEHNSAGTAQESLLLGAQGAQSFIHGAVGAADYRIRRLVLYVPMADLVPGSGLMVSIGTAPHSAPLPGSIVSVDLMAAADPSNGGSFAPVEVLFDQPVGPLIAGATYFINVEPDGLISGLLTSVERSPGNAYPPGTFFRNGNDTGRDLRFEVWGN